MGIRSLAYIWQAPEGKGLPSAIAQVEHFIKDGKLVVVCGDVLVEKGIKKPVEDFIRQDRGARLTGVSVEDTAGYSPLVVEGETVRKILPKDKNRHEPGLIDLEIYMYHPDVFQKIRCLTPSSRGETEIWDLNQKYADQGTLKLTIIDRWWSDVGGSIETYLEAHRRYETK